MSSIKRLSTLGKELYLTVLRCLDLFVNNKLNYEIKKRKSEEIMVLLLLLLYSCRAHV